MCAFGHAVAMSVNLNSHKFKGAYMSAINTLNSDILWGCFFSDKQDLFLT